jgi:alkyldihydroxyacetonephosphate synthase
MPTATRRLKHWGWGYDDQQPSTNEVEGIARAVTDRLGFEVDEIEEPVPLDSVELAQPRLKPPKRFGEIFSADPYDRIAHSLGKAYRDVVRGFRGQFPNPPDLVAYPESPEDVDVVLNFCADEKAAAIPFGGGTSVVGGVEPRGLEEYRGVVTVDMRRMDGSEVDPVSMAARIQAGATGPGLEEQLREPGHAAPLPAVVQCSTLGGWIATRAGGHFATLYTHIDDLVESVRAVTLDGEWESRSCRRRGGAESGSHAARLEESRRDRRRLVRVRERPNEAVPRRSPSTTSPRGRGGPEIAGRPLSVELPPARRGRVRDPLGGAARQGAARPRFRVRPSPVEDSLAL